METNITINTSLKISDKLLDEINTSLAFRNYAFRLKRVNIPTVDAIEVSLANEKGLEFFIISITEDCAQMLSDWFADEGVKIEWNSSNTIFSAVAELNDDYKLGKIKD